ncbi:MAG: hypothetical protein B7Z66_02870 [Chromatiales bacterium 21-64-14]|nr:MAG: hypothetical protein B7Z66_02870 [Chromatiales bacterium 21-64-14]HQU15727.1 hypothetical protein [Gammaproteobacteria bacterium]
MYIAPKDLYKKTKNMAFLGKVSCHTDRLVAGSWDEIVLDYEVGASGIADGAWVKATFKFYSDWALFQTDDPTGANYVSAEYQAGPLASGQSPATVQSLKVRFDQKGHERPFQKAVIVDTVDGYLKPGDHIIIRLGDKRAGGPGTRVQTFVEEGFRFRCYVDPLGTSRFAAIPGDIVIDVVPGTPAQLQLVGSRMLRIDQKLPIRVRAEDEWGNTCRDLDGKVAIEATLNGEKVYERTVGLAGTGWAVALLDDLPTKHAGELILTARMLDRPGVPEHIFYVTISDDLSVPRLYYGDLHVHSDDTVGTNNTVYNLTYGRDVSGLDVLGYTANDFQVTKARWDAAVETIDGLNKNGEFVCYPGTEWCGNSCAGGDHNVVFLHGKKPEFPFDKDGNVCRSFEWNEDMASDTIEPGAWPLEELWATYAHDPEGHLLMPHVGGRRCILDWHHPVLERLVEIGSAWGQFPWLYRETMARGYKLGASANGDEHRGRCGGGVPGTAVFGVKGGVTGIIAEKLDRKTVGKALRARHTWATTGERTVGLSWCGKHIQGDEFEHQGGAEVGYRFLGDVGWEEIAAYDHTGLIWRRNLHEECGYSDRRIRLRWGGARIKDRYRWATWKGTITIINGVINNFRGVGFEHREESAWRGPLSKASHGEQKVSFRSDTYGDADGIELDVSNLGRCRIRVEGTIDGYVKVGNPLDGNPFIHCPEFCWELTGEELMAGNGALIKELGGQDMFLAMERLTEAGLPRDMPGAIDIDPRNGPHGFRPVYIAGRQLDQSMAWTSALFISFK